MLINIFPPRGKAAAAPRAGGAAVATVGRVRRRQRVRLVELPPCPDVELSPRRFDIVDAKLWFGRFTETGRLARRRTAHRLRAAALQQPRPGPPPDHQAARGQRRAAPKSRRLREGLDWWQVRHRLHPAARRRRPDRPVPAADARARRRGSSTGPTTSPPARRRSRPTTTTRSPTARSTCCGSSCSAAASRRRQGRARPAGVGRLLAAQQHGPAAEGHRPRPVDLRRAVPALLPHAARGWWCGRSTRRRSTRSSPTTRTGRRLLLPPAGADAHRAVRAAQRNEAPTGRRPRRDEVRHPPDPGRGDRPLPHQRHQRRGARPVRPVPVARLHQAAPRLHDEPRRPGGHGVAVRLQARRRRRRRRHREAARAVPPQQAARARVGARRSTSRPTSSRSGSRPPPARSAATRSPRR
jgi:hypothetical protein